MKRILVLGAGRSATYLIERLLAEAESHGWFVTVGDGDRAAAETVVDGHARAEAIELDINDAQHRGAQIEGADVVVNMLPARFLDLVAWDCVGHGRHMISVSYRTQAGRELDRDARRNGALLLYEMGLDPGIDHISAIALIRQVERDGGRVTGFRSYGSGIPAPDGPTNPLRYVVTWDPRNVVMAGAEGAQYKEDGQIKIVPYHDVFHHTWAVDVEGLGVLEAYANRDSLAYVEQFDLQDVRTMIRGTLRWPGWSETWSAIVRLGLPNETLRIPGLAQRTYRDVTEMFVPSSVAGSTLEQQVARLLRISPTGRILENLRWLGLFDDEPIGCPGDTSAAMMVHLLKQRLALAPDGRDLIVLIHEVDVEYDDARESECRVSTLVANGEANGHTAMSRSVGLPVLIALRLLLAGDLPLSGSHLPTHPSVVAPVLAGLREEGLAFTERVRPLASG